MDSIDEVVELDSLIVTGKKSRSRSQLGRRIETYLNELTSKTRKRKWSWSRSKSVSRNATRRKDELLRRFGTHELTISVEIGVEELMKLDDVEFGCPMLELLMTVEKGRDEVVRLEEIDEGPALELMKVEIGSDEVDVGTALEVIKVEVDSEEVEGGALELMKVEKDSDDVVKSEEVEVAGALEVVKVEEVSDEVMISEVVEIGVSL